MNTRHLTVLILGFIFVACSAAPMELEDRTMRVDRLFFVNEGYYQFFVLNEKTQELEPKFVKFNLHSDSLNRPRRVHVVQDVLPDGKMWVRLVYIKGQPHKLMGAEFHVRSPRDIEGGEENLGKFGVRRNKPI